MLKNPLANAGDMGFEPWSGKIPHATEQLSPCATAIEPALRNKGGHCSEKPVHCSKEWPPFASTREKPRCSNRDLVQPKIKNK